MTERDEVEAYIERQLAQAPPIGEEIRLRLIRLLSSPALNER